MRVGKPPAGGFVQSLKRLYPGRFRHFDIGRPRCDSHAQPIVRGKGLENHFAHSTGHGLNEIVERYAGDCVLRRLPRRVDRISLRRSAALGLGGLDWRRIGIGFGESRVGGIGASRGRCDRVGPARVGFGARRRAGLPRNFRSAVRRSGTCLPPPRTPRHLPRRHQAAADRWPAAQAYPVLCRATAYPVARNPAQRRSASDRQPQRLRPQRLSK